MNNANDTLGVDEAASLLRAEVATVMQYARRGELPGTRIGKAWVFLREDVMAFLRSQIATDTEQRRKHKTPEVLAISVPPPRHGRRNPLPELPPLPQTNQTAKKRSP